MCRVGPCDGTHHLEDAQNGPRAAETRPGSETQLPPRTLPDAGPSLRRRRNALGGLVSATAIATVACTAGPEASAAPAKQAIEPSPSSAPALAEAPPAAPTAAPNPLPTAVPVPEPSLHPLGVQGIIQPVWANGRILYYDKPADGPSGTWSVDAAAQLRFERPQWGYYWADGGLVAAPRTVSRDTYVTHVPTGREWSLPTTNSPTFSPDGTWVAYPTAALGQPGGAPPGPGSGFTGSAPAFVLSNIVVAPDGTPNVRLLLNGRRANNDDPSLWAFDVRDRALIELTRSKRLAGALPSPDGTWLAHVSMWNADSAQNGLWLTRTDGSVRRRMAFIGSYRWTKDNRLLVIPHRASHADGHEVWRIIPDAPGEDAASRLVDPAKVQFRVSNFDWDCSADGTGICFVSADDKSLWYLEIPAGTPGTPNVPMPEIPQPAPSGTSAKPYRLPFKGAPGLSTWYVSQWYGVTTGGYRGRNSTYSQGQGIHFGIDFATACGTEVLALAAGRVIAVDGGYGSPPHNVVLQLFDGNIAVYGHLIERTRHVEVGQAVQPGQVLGNSGDSIAPYNCTRNPHLHLEIRKQGRGVATNPVPYFDVNWDDLSLGVWPGARFERDLDTPNRNQFLDEQPDIWFGGPIITNFARPWPP
jgi:murein DD-endopeptidase MepM/ murein hydrolase activator NlpD